MKKILAGLAVFEKVFCGLLLLLILALLTYQVVVRYGLNTPSLVSEEIARYFYIVFVYISMSYAEGQNAHIRIEMLPKVFPRFLRGVAMLAGQLIYLGFAAAMTWVCAEEAYSVYSMGWTSLTLEINLGIVYAGIALGYLLLTVRIFANLVAKRYLPADHAADAGQQPG